MSGRTARAQGNRCRLPFLEALESLIAGGKKPKEGAAHHSVPVHRGVIRGKARKGKGDTHAQDARQKGKKKKKKSRAQGADIEA